MEGSLTEKDRHAFAVNARLNLKQALIVCARLKKILK